MSDQILTSIHSVLEQIKHRLESTIEINSFDITSVQEESNEKLDSIVKLLETLCEIERDGMSANSLGEHLRNIYDGLGEINERISRIENIIKESN